MSFSIEPGQVFVECGLAAPSRPLRRVKVKAVFPYGSDWVPAGMAFIASLEDDGREMRLRAIKLNKLHVSPRTQYGHPRRQGYLLETSFPEVGAISGWVHNVRPIPSNTFPDMFEAACGVRGRSAHVGDSHTSCSPCAARLDDILTFWSTR